MRILRRDDEGFTMLAVLASAMLVMALVLVGIGYATVSVQRSRTSQDTRGALAAAQAGVQDYLSRLNNCETYYLATNTCTNVNSAALTTPAGAVVPGTTGATQARYTQRVISTPLTTGGTGGVRLEVTGSVNGESRTLTVDLTRGGFLEYLYYTDYETFSPSNTRKLFLDEPVIDLRDSRYNSSYSYTFTGSGTARQFTLHRWKVYTLKAPTVDQVARGCERYRYGTATKGARDTFPRTVSVDGNDYEIWPKSSENTPFDIGNFTCLTISFSGNDTFDGPVHSNDALRLSGPVTFKKNVTTSWSTTGKTWYGDSDPSSTSKKPLYHDPLKMPETATQQADLAAANGCVYTGPTSIRFLSNGRIEVVSPNSVASQLNAGCTTGTGTSTISTAQTVNGPANGIIYVRSTTTQNNCINQFQRVTGDVTDYDNNNCRAGDAFVQGDVSGQMTVTAEHDVVVTGDVRYAGGLSGTDVLGLIGQNNVVVWNPVRQSNGGFANINASANRRIDAAIASVSNSFTVFNYDKGSRIGTLNINGVIIQKYRGPVATGSGSVTSTGYAKDYRYDSRLSSLPPPSFIAPVNDPWSVGTLTEQ
ncbi:hypothetical protein [Kineococcus auxinigenes]|uniref:hypothetical protein n=1 Tax=unclassified Kineococcus TaxID=2621656 RepID=UPI003D7DE990